MSIKSISGRCLWDIMWFFYGWDGSWRWLLMMISCKWYKFLDVFYCWKRKWLMVKVKMGWILEYPSMLYRNGKIRQHLKTLPSKNFWIVSSGYAPDSNLKSLCQCHPCIRSRAYSDNEKGGLAFKNSLLTKIWYNFFEKSIDSLESHYLRL